MPIAIVSGEQGVFLNWSEWEEVSAHIEHCSALQLEDQETETEAPGGAYETCGKIPGVAPGGDPRFGCMLVAGHGTVNAGGPGTENRFGYADAHMNRYGYTWPDDTAFDL